jgi:catechol 2,3-dioxygenase-like lactoylglutathione lyase family enzyme
MLRFGHLSLGVSDLDASERFYRDVLGLPAERVGEQTEVRFPDFLLVLTSNPPAARGKFHFGFRVESAAEVDRWARRLRDCGAGNVSGPSGDDGDRKVIFIDPDGYQIEIYAHS